MANAAAAYLVDGLLKPAIFTVMLLCLLFIESPIAIAQRVAPPACEAAEVMQGMHRLSDWYAYVAQQNSATKATPPPGCPLLLPDEYSAVDSVLSGTLIARVQNWQVHGAESNLFMLRTYGFQPAGSDSTRWSIPGPTFRLRKGSRPAVGAARYPTDGDRFHLTLINRMPRNPSSPFVCDDRPGVSNFPDCFHGDNNTNFHFHGFHVSPQPHQDFVVLNLFPEASPYIMNPADPTMAKGRYEYRLDPLVWTQSEGTHWYHPHKHGSTALQVLNGMAGTFLIHGPFDDWLDEWYTSRGTGLKEQVLVVQQIWDDINFWHEFAPNDYPPLPTVNSQLYPVVTMQPGEVQRWRFVGATMQQSAHLQVGFEVPPSADSSSVPQVKQIAQDGVRFSPPNYQQQPYFRNGDFILAPGQRADFLIQAPQEEGVHVMTSQIVGNIADRVQERMEENAQEANNDAAIEEQALGIDPGEIPLLFVKVEGDPVRYRNGETFPQDLPLMPVFLHDIDISRADTTRHLVFSMENGMEGDSTTRFFIDGTGYDPFRIDQRMKLDTIEKWVVSNTSTIAHPLHIHVNPYQLASQVGRTPDALVKDKANKTFTLQPASEDISRTFDPPIWHDTVPLPETVYRVAISDVKIPDSWTLANPSDLDSAWVTAFRMKPDANYSQKIIGEVTIYQHFIDFTGEYVQHCHILGHEDRGMMQNLETVCKGSLEPDKPQPGLPECGCTPSQ